MEHKERKIDFREADRRCAELKRQHDAGVISDEEFDAQRKKLMVQDDEGRWWAKGREADEWYYRDESGWVKGTPPGYQPYRTSPTVDSQEHRAQPEQNERYQSSPAAREDDKPRWRRRWVPILSLLLLLLALLGGTAYALIRAANENVAVPDLVGASSVGEAQKIAGGSFEVVEGDGIESREPIGTVIEQDLAAGEMVGEGSIISVNVSKGVNLPDVRDETRDEAVRILEGAGFEVEEETEESSAENEGYVTEQDPRGGRRENAEAGSTVTVTVGEGPDDTETGSADVTASPAPEKAAVPKQAQVPERTPVPNVVGRNVEEAKQTIQNAGFAYAIETVQSNQPIGTVVSTDPAPGTLLVPSSRVTIRQSSGLPPPVDNKGAADGEAGKGEGDVKGEEKG
jgi:beta-lactam-binding protein with PASTA domain